MAKTVVNAFIYENLSTVSVFNDNTRLCIYEPSHKLFIVKSVAVSFRLAYEAIMKINNPHIAKIYYIAEKTDCIEVVREYIQGDTVAELLRNTKYLSQEQALKISSDVCIGLSDIHKAGYVHRDINPNNIIVTPDGCAKIIDFGITRYYSKDKNADTAILGTPGYAAPEQFGFSQSDARTDIYSVGVLMNVMLTGELPSKQMFNGQIGKIIKKCIEIDSKHRYNDIDELNKAISNKTPAVTGFDRVIKKIPGFRSGNVFAAVFAFLVYFALFVFSWAIFATVKNGMYFQTVISWILCFPVPFFCFTNFLDIRNKLPFSKGATKRNQIIVYCFFGVMSILIGLIIFGAINMP